MDGFVRVSPFAWSGWRLALPGDPPGGQYHGFTANDGLNGLGDPGASPVDGTSAGPWDSTWGGIELQEGEDQSDYVFRSSAEMRPRPNASGGANVITEFQHRRGGPLQPKLLPHTIGLLPRYNVDDPRFEIPLPVVHLPGRNIARVTGTPLPAKKPTPTVGPVPRAVIPVPKPRVPGPTSTTKQPPPPSSPAPAPTVPGQCAAGQYRDAAGNCTADWRNPYSLYLPQSPAPAPTVAASPSDFLPSDGQPLVDSTAATTASWFSEETLIPGIQNGYVAGGAALLLLLMFKGRR